MLNYDPDQTPDLDSAQLHEATRLGLFPIQIICDEKAAQPGDEKGVNFMAYVKSIPRIGERVELEDTSICEVTSVYHVISRCGQSQFFGLVVNVYAVYLGKPE